MAYRETDGFRVEDLTEEDQAALAGELDLGKRICEFYLEGGDPSTLETLDELFDLWVHDPREKKPTGNEIALGVGSLLGEYLRGKYGCRWIISDGPFGVELGLIHPETQWQFFPRHWIAKRLDPENAGRQILASLVRTMESKGMFGS